MTTSIYTAQGRMTLWRFTTIERPPAEAAYPISSNQPLSFLRSQSRGTVTAQAPTANPKAIVAVALSTACTIPDSARSPKNVTSMNAPFSNLLSRISPNAHPAR